MKLVHSFLAIRQSSKEGCKQMRNKVCSGGHAPQRGPHMAALVNSQIKYANRKKGFAILHCILFSKMYSFILVVLFQISLFHLFFWHLFSLHLPFFCFSPLLCNATIFCISPLLSNITRMLYSPSLPSLLFVLLQQLLWNFNGMK